MDDVKRCLDMTGVEGVMSSEALLENPALFSGQVHDLDKLAKEYIEIARAYKTDEAYVRPHLFKILYAGLQVRDRFRILANLIYSSSWVIFAGL